MIEFFMEFIVFRFAVPMSVVTDNGTQFMGEKFESMLSELKMKHLKASVAYPQANGQVEVSNRAILQGLKKRIQDQPRNWVDELPNVLWSYRMTPRTVTGETPFRLASSTDVVISVEISLNSPRIEDFEGNDSVEGLRLDNDLLEEVRDEEMAAMVQYQNKIVKHFNKGVKTKNFQVNNLLLRESASSQPTVTGKLKAPWEGPYKISRVIHPGTYELKQLDGEVIKNAWNGIHLKFFNRWLYFIKTMTNSATLHL